ncbi:hypothetical protein [Rubripirellula tenax]|nr:hypothetical protein [Rubripirellula tenax]
MMDASFAERPPEAEGLDAGRASPANVGPTDSGFFGGPELGSGVVRFQLIQGRLCLDSPRHRKGSQSCQEGDCFESICVTAQRGIPSLHYVLESPQQNVTLNVQDASEIRIESWIPTSNTRSLLHHDDSGAIVWERESDGNTIRSSGATLLHLRQLDPNSFDAHFGTLIMRMLNGTSLETLGRQTHRAMLDEASNSEGTTVATTEVASAIAALRSPRRHVRATAERQLLMWGTPALALIDSLDTGQWDSEQADRIAAVRRRLRRNDSDTPAKLAKLLVNDDEYWASMSDRLTGAQRTVAENHLRRVGLEVSLSSPAIRVAKK